MNVGIGTHNPFSDLMDMPIMEYIRYEKAYVRQIQAMQRAREK